MLLQMAPIDVQYNGHTFDDWLYLQCSLLFLLRSIANFMLLFVSSWTISVQKVLISLL